MSKVGIFAVFGAINGLDFWALPELKCGNITVGGVSSGASFNGF